MGDHPTNFEGSIPDAIREAVLVRIPDARVAASGGNGHWNIEVVSPVFAGKSMLESQRLVLGSIKHLMSGEMPPIHAVDSIRTKAE